jgi:hypothetical protein
MHVVAQCFVLGREMDVAAAHGEPGSLPGWGGPRLPREQHGLGPLQLLGLAVDHNNIAIA